MPIQTPREYKFIGDSRYLLKKYGKEVIMLLGGHASELIPDWREKAAVSPVIDRYLIREVYDDLPDNNEVYFTAKINDELVGELVNAVELLIPQEEEEETEESIEEEIHEDGSIN